MTENLSKHQISVGLLVKDSLKKEKQVGSALYVPDSNKPYYKLQLWQYQNSSFYLVLNKDGENYTLFSQVSLNTDFDDNSSPIFQNPIGYGFHHKVLKEFIQVQLNFPWQRCFISLHPEL